MDSNMLKILHLTNMDLPNWRTEKAAISGLNRGEDVVFAGTGACNYDNTIFSKIYQINWTAGARLGIPFYWHSVKKQVERVIREVRPDIVHAHNIFSAKMISQFDYPYVYDDYEYWSQFSKMLSEMVDKLFSRPASAKALLSSIFIGLPRKIRRILLNQHAVSLWTRWEKEVVSSVPTITVCNNMAEGLRSRINNNKVFVVPNFPMRSETQDLEMPYRHRRLSSVYAGSDGLNRQKIPSRNFDGIIKTFIDHNIGPLSIIGWENKSQHPKIRHCGRFNSRRDMFDEMLKHSIGLIPFKKHWWHEFFDPNKAYEYSHAGLFVICTSDIMPVRQTLQDNCAVFEDYDDLVSQLEYFRDNMEVLYTKRKKTFEFAKNNLVWENHEKYIFQAYQLC